jgi:hypothetical protein
MGIFGSNKRLDKNTRAAIRRAKGDQGKTNAFLSLFEPSVEKVYNQMERRRKKNNRCAMVQDYHDV